jgi:hypothetical protein
MGSTTGTPTDLYADVRTARTTPAGGSFGYLLPATSILTGLKTGSTTTLFTGASESDVSILSISSLADAKGTVSLFAADGTLRGSGDFEVFKNASLTFNPASSAFGLPPQPGDVVEVAVTLGSLEAAVLVFDSGTTDVAPSLPGTASTQSVIPYAAAIPEDGQSIVSDLFLSNPSTDATATVTVSFAALGATGAAPTATLTLLPQESQSVSNVLPTLFSVDAGAGALVVTSDVPVVASERIATATAAGDYGTFANAIDASQAIAGGHAGVAVGLPQTSTRVGYLLLYNSGAAGSVTVTGFRSDGTEAGHLSVPLGSQSAGFLGGVFAALGVPNQAAGRIRVDVPDGMTVFGWTAALDVPTGDIDILPLR